MNVCSEPVTWPAVVGIGVVERVGVEDRRNARALLVAGRRVEREREVGAVLALVLHQALLDGAHRGRGIGDVRDRNARRSERLPRPPADRPCSPSVRMKAFGGSVGD